MKAKFFYPNGPSPTFFYPMFANCVHTKTMFVHVSECKLFFSLKCSKFAVECEWNNKNCQNSQSLEFFGKIARFFGKTLNFFKIATCDFPECVSNGIFSWKCLSSHFLRLFLAKIRKNLKFEKLENMMKKQSFMKKKRFRPSKRHL